MSRSIITVISLYYKIYNNTSCKDQEKTLSPHFCEIINFLSIYNAKPFKALTLYKKNTKFNTKED